MVHGNITHLKIGILGGGQLGRMLVQAAINYDLDVAVLDPDPRAPCAHLVKNFQAGEITDQRTVIEWGRSLDLISIEIEDVNVDALKELRSKGITIYPQPEVIELIQDKRTQKTFYKANGIPAAAFVLTENKQDIFRYGNMLPAVQKLGREGYDGQGVQVIHTKNDLHKAFDKPGLLEKYIDFEKELSMIVARNEKGEVASYPAVELSYHPQRNVAEFLFAPADISKETERNAHKLAGEVIEKLGMVGLLAVEMFLDKEGRLYVNESAPRTHNSGHHTIEANFTSQFEQHLRAILNLPLGSTKARTPAAMVNILGADNYWGDAIYRGVEDCMAIEGVYIHLYGKKKTRPFRKMGHVTILHEDIGSLKMHARKIKNLIKVIA